MVYLLCLFGLLVVAKWVATCRYEIDCRRDFERKCAPRDIDRAKTPRVNDSMENEGLTADNERAQLRYMQRHSR